MWYFCDVQYSVLYGRVSCFVVRGCDVLKRYIHVCNCDMFSVVNVYLDHLMFCVVCINVRRYVCCRECNVVSDDVMNPHPVLGILSIRTVVKLCTLGVFALGVIFVS